MNLQKILQYKKQLKEQGPQPLNITPSMAKKMQHIETIGINPSQNHIGTTNNNTMMSKYLNSKKRNAEDNAIVDDIDTIINQINNLGKKKFIGEKKEKVINNIKVYLNKFK